MVDAYVYYIAARKGARLTCSCVAVSCCTLGASVMVRLWEWRGVWFPVWQGFCQGASVGCRLPCFSECSLVTHLRQAGGGSRAASEEGRPCV